MELEQYERLIHYMAHKYQYGADYEDLYQAGMLGLKNACLHYDPTKDSDFVNYACIYIKGEMIKANNSVNQIKVSRDMYKLQQEIKKTKEELTQTLHREATSMEIAYVLGQNVETIEQAESLAIPIYSLDKEDVDDSYNLYQSIAQKEYGYDDTKLDIDIALDHLDEKDKQLILSRYFEDRTQQETADILGMNKVQVSRQEQKILKKMRTFLDVA